ncbi:MAG: GNAT family N-acetyltransferase [Hungatella sp.]|nr:GNAT family N-acetyltransferase [Hungatella sp.]
MGETVRYLEQWEKRRTMPLWREAFWEDTEEFLEYYYKEKSSDNRILVMEEGDRIVSMVHRNPYRLRLGGREADIDYIVAVATASDWRHRGYMRKLLLKMLNDMGREKMAFCFLMPADRRIYEPFGFAFIYDQEHWKLTKEAEQGLAKEKVDSDTAALAAEWMDRWLGQRYQVWAVRDKRYADRLLLELASENGWLELLYQKERPGGGPVGIRGWWGIGKTEQRLLLCGSEYREEQRSPCPAIMARIGDVKTCLELISLKKDSLLDRLEVTLHVEDRMCGWNQGTFLWKLDRRGSLVMEEAEGEENGMGGRGCLFITIEDLTQWIFGYRELEELADREELAACAKAAVPKEPVSRDRPGFDLGMRPGDAARHVQEESDQRTYREETVTIRWWLEIGVWKKVFLDEIV